MVKNKSIIETYLIYGTYAYLLDNNAILWTTARSSIYALYIIYTLTAVVCTGLFSCLLESISSQTTNLMPFDINSIKYLKT